MTTLVKMAVNRTRLDVHGTAAAVRTSNKQLRRRNSSSDGALGCQATDEEQQSGRYLSTVQGLHDPVAKARMIPCSSIAIKQQCSYTKKLRDP